MSKKGKKAIGASAGDIRAAYERLRQWADDGTTRREDYYSAHMRQQFILTARVVDAAIDELLLLRQAQPLLMDAAQAQMARPEGKSDDSLPPH